MAAEIKGGAAYPKLFKLRHAGGGVWIIALHAVSKDGMRFEVRAQLAWCQAATVSHAHSSGGHTSLAHERCPPNFTPAVQKQACSALVACLDMRVGDLLRLELVVEECSAEMLVATVQSG